MPNETDITAKGVYDLIGKEVVSKLIHRFMKIDGVSWVESYIKTDLPKLRLCKVFIGKEGSPSRTSVNIFIDLSEQNSYFGATGNNKARTLDEIEEYITLLVKQYNKKHAEEQQQIGLTEITKQRKAWEEIRKALPDMGELIPNPKLNYLDLRDNRCLRWAREKKEALQNPITIKLHHVDIIVICWEPHWDKLKPEDGRFASHDEIRCLIISKTTVHNGKRHLWLHGRNPDEVTPLLPTSFKISLRKALKSMEYKCQ